MAERQKIIIQTGADTDESLPAPHFDAEATLTAQPVVPLSEQEAVPAHYGYPATRAAKPFWGRTGLVAFVLLVAAGIGVAAGFAIGIYRNRSAAPPAVQTQPSSSPEATTQIAQQPTPQPRATISEKVDETPVEQKTDERARPEQEDRDRKTSAGNEPKSDKNDEREATLRPSPPPSARDRKRDKADDDEVDQVFEERQAERERRREERREVRRRQREAEDQIDVPRQIQRAGQQINRIRDIFEGRQP